MAAVLPPAQQQFINFVLDLWRPGRDRNSTQPGQPSVATGARNAWNRLTPGDQVTTTGQLARHATETAALAADAAAQGALPNQVPDSAVTGTIRRFYTRCYNNRTCERVRVASVENIIAFLRAGPVRKRLAAHLVELQARVEDLEQALRGMLHFYTRNRNVTRAIGPNGPAREGAQPTYLEIEEYLRLHLGPLHERLDARERFAEQLNAAILARAGLGGVVPRGETIYLVDLHTRNTDSIVLIERAIELIEQWRREQEHTRSGRPVDRIAADTPSVNDLIHFIVHLDDLKGLQAAAIRMNDYYADRLPGRPNPGGTDVATIWNWIAIQAATHVNWVQRATPEIPRLQALFHNVWGDPTTFDAAQVDQFTAVANEAIIDFMVSDGELSGSWLGPMLLGRGAHGSASVWIKQDAAGGIVDRVSVKDTRNMNPHDGGNWATWKPPPGWPLEVAAMYKLSDLPGSGSILGIRNWKQQVLGHRGHRIYAEYCGRGGDLHSFQESNYPQGNPEFLTEPFLWAVLDSLVTAGLLMEGNHLRPEARPLWELIVHGDMKPDNALLADNNTNTFRGFPSTKLADFGIAFIVPTAGISPAGWREFSGPGYRAPEMAHTSVAPQSAVQGSLVPDSKANVWGVGIILRGLMHSRPWDGLWAMPGNDGILPWTPPDFTVVDRGRYSVTLRNLVNSCLNVGPDLRPSFTDLRQQIIQNTGPPGTNADLRGLRDAPINDPRFDQWLPRGLNDKYQIGMAVDRLVIGALPPARRRDPPALASPVTDVVGGPSGAITRVGAAQVAGQINGAQRLLQSVGSDNKTFESTRVGG